MGKESKPGKKLSMKTRLIVILVVFVIINLIFYVAFDDNNNSTEETEITQDEVKPEVSSEEELFDKFNPPNP